MSDWRISPLRVQFLEERTAGEHRYRAFLTEPLFVASSEADVTVPAGFRTDFASVPRFFWRIASPVDARAAAVVHDYLYDTALVDKATADRYFYEIMVSQGVPRWRARLMYWAVSRFAGRAWRNHRERDKAHG